MRLRLTVQRHRLPPANVLWSVPANASPQAYTISRLLEDVNAILPLEAEHWGLEDYVVEVGGFECLHFTPVAQALKDDDELVIRPLLTAEVRSRALSGRYQISGAGQHLVDGVPFGKPCLRPPTNRPQIRIPPCKRPRMLEDTDGGAEEESVAALITANGEVPSAEATTLGRYNAVNKSPAPHKHAGHEKTVRFDDAVDYEESACDEEDDEDFDPNEIGDTSDVSMDNDSSEDSDSSASTSNSGSDSDSDSDDDTDSSSSGDESKSSQTSGPEVASSKPAPASTFTNRVPPLAGSKSTKARNQRRTLAQKRRRLVESGLLPEQATLQDARQHIEQGGIVPDADTTTDAAQAQKPSNKRKRGGSDMMPEEQLQAGDELEERRKQLLAELNLDAILKKNAKTGEHGEPSQVLEQSPVQEPVQGPFQEPARKRLRPNISAIRRILSHQATPMDKRSPKLQRPTVEEPQAPPDPNFWKSKINLSAFECWNEEHELSAPPFPFEQYWDPAHELMNPNHGKPGKKRKAEALEEVVEETPDITDLDYGGPSTSTISRDTDNAEPDLDSAAAIESQLRQDVATATRTDLPSLPEDVDSLPILSEADAKAGAIIVFKTFDLNMATMNPEISGYKTAIVEAESDSQSGNGEIELRLAERDITHMEKKFDKKGNRIYNRADHFRMGDSDEEDGEEDGIVYHAFLDLLEAKLLKASG